MSYDQNFKQKVIDSYKSIGATKTAAFFKIGRKTIYRWAKEVEKDDSNEYTNQQDKRNNNQANLHLQRSSITNNKLNFYIYTITDLDRNTEFNNVCFYNNRHTPFFVLEYLISVYKKLLKTNNFRIFISGFRRFKTLSEFKIKGVSLEFERTRFKPKIKALETDFVSAITNKSELLSKLTDKQILFNCLHSTIKDDNLRYLIPREISRNNSNYLFKDNLSVVNDSVYRILRNLGTLISIDFSPKIIEELNSLYTLVIKINNPGLLVWYHKVRNLYYYVSGEVNILLALLKKELTKTVFSEVKACLLFEICNIYVRNYDLKNFDFYLNLLNANIKLLKELSASNKINLAYLRVQRESLNLSPLEYISRIRQIMDKYKKEIDHYRLCRFEMIICELLTDSGKFTEAKRLLNNLREEVKRKNDPFTKSNFLYHQAKLLIKQGNHKKAFIIGVELEDFAVKYNLQDFKYLGKSIKVLFYLESGNINLVKKILTEISIYSELTSTVMIKLVLLKLNQLYYIKIRKLKKAYEINSEEIAMCSSSFLNKRIYAQALSRRIFLKSNLYSFSSAKEEIKEFQSICTFLKDNFSLIQFYILKGYYFYDRKEYLTSLKLYKKGLNLSRKNNITILNYQIFYYIAEIKRKSKEFRSAIYNINQSLYYCSLEKKKSEYPRMKYLKGLIYFEANDFKKAEEYLRESLADSLTLNDLNFQEKSEKLLKKIKRKLVSK